MKHKKNNIKNTQYCVARIYRVIFIISSFLIILPFMSNTVFSGLWFMVILGVFFSVSSFIISLIFNRRAKKLDKLLVSDNQLIHHVLDDKMLKSYAELQKKEAIKKNSTAMKIISFMFVFISVPFLFMLESDEIAGFIGIMSVILILLFIASKFFPVYYYKKNMKGDRNIIIGEKYAYFNGVFHNWDYPLSGLSKVKEIKKPFNGLYLAYYYTDMTWENVGEIKIPFPESCDLEPLIGKLKEANKKGKKG